MSDDLFHSRVSRPDPPTGLRLTRSAPPPAAPPEVAEGDDESVGEQTPDIEHAEAVEEPVDEAHDEAADDEHDGFEDDEYDGDDEDDEEIATHDPADLVAAAGPASRDLFLRFFVVVCAMALIALALLTLRQQRLLIAHRLIEKHRELDESRQGMWETQARIAEQLQPERLRDAFEEAGLSLDAVQPEQDADWLESPMAHAQRHGYLDPQQGY